MRMDLLVVSVLLPHRMMLGSMHEWAWRLIGGMG